MGKALICGIIILALVLLFGFTAQIIECPICKSDYWTMMICPYCGHDGRMTVFQFLELYLYAILKS